ncbi:hypothetical protein Y032_0136g1972 [Ancylostoma ceylanicum]|uniref:Uncharacterized protein n=1 Tax=Ancylostoma ceylanicum TaxID=53326 RepID=A0A016T4F3_9BILA|nr:hypothetical protein Y032_0136g1972 [Ancylostoma ceylanicum]
MVLYRLTTSLGIVRHVGKKFCATQITFLICVLNCLYYDKDATIYHRRARKNTDAAKDLRCRYDLQRNTGILATTAIMILMQLYAIIT